MPIVPGLEPGQRGFVLDISYAAESRLLAYDAAGTLVCYCGGKLSSG